MKKTIVVTTLVLLGALGFTVNAQAATCGDVVWNADYTAEYPTIAGHCLEVVDKNGSDAVRLRARVVRQGVNSTVVQWLHPDGSWSDSERRYPQRGATASIEGRDVRISDLSPRQEVNVYVPATGNWSFPAAAPVAAAPPPPPAPEPEPEPVALPTTATQIPMLAILGGLMLLMGGLVSVGRSRL